RRGGEIIAGAGRLEVGRIEGPARAEHVIAIRIAPIALRVRVENLACPRPRRPIVPASEGGERGEMRGALGQPEMLKAHPAPIVALAPPGFAAARTAVVGWTPRIEREAGAVLGTEAPIGRQNGLWAGTHG